MNTPTKTSKTIHIMKTSIHTDKEQKTQPQKRHKQQIHKHT